MDKALDYAMTQQFNLLFGMLCQNIVSDQQTAEQNFVRGLEILLQASAIAKKAMTP